MRKLRALLSRFRGLFAETKQDKELADEVAEFRFEHGILNETREGDLGNASASVSKWVTRRPERNELLSPFCD
jgi:hypothetical protein